jgi:hypothetical protein
VSEKAVSFGSAAPARPMTTIMRIVNAQMQKTIDLPPTGLCSPDVAQDQDCAGQKLHFRVTEPAAISIDISGDPKAVSPFQLLLDPIAIPQPDDQMAISKVYTSYLAFDDRTPTRSPVAKYHLSLSRGQRVGVLFGSPDFGGMLEIRDSHGGLVAQNGGFNEFFDPCDKVRIDRLPAVDPLSQADSYVTFEASDDMNYEVVVRARNTGETGLYIVRTFDLKDSAIEPERMRSGVLRHIPAQFSLLLLPHWRALGPQVTAYSPLPISITLKDSSGRSLLNSGTATKPDIKTGLQPSQLSMLYSATLDLDPLDDTTISNSHIEVAGIDPPDGQFFLVGLAASWGSCGGGAVDPIAVVYPQKSDFKDVGFPLTGSKAPLSQFEALLYSVARRKMNWYFLLQSPDGDQIDPVDLISNYAHFEPEHVPITAYLVDYQIALRAQFSPNIGTIRVWTRVERKGFKENLWQFDLSESARAQQRLADTLRDQLAGQK